MSSTDVGIGDDARVNGFRTLRARAREAEPSGGPNPARALDRGAGRFLFDLIDGSERWGGAGAAALAAALELDPMGRG